MFTQVCIDWMQDVIAEYSLTVSQAARKAQEKFGFEKIYIYDLICDYRQPYISGDWHLPPFIVKDSFNPTV